MCPAGLTRAYHGPYNGPFAQACEHRVGLVDLVADGAEIGADRAEIGARATRRTC